MKRLILATLLALSAPLALAAPPSEAQIDRLLEVMRARQTLDAVLPQVEASQQQMFAQMTANQSLTEAQRAQAQRVLDKTMKSTRELLGWDKMQPLYRDIYGQTFTSEDMEAMTTFYASPAGQKLLDKMPLLVQNTMTAMQKVVMPMMQQLEKDVAAELQAPVTPVDVKPATDKKS